MRGRSWMAAAGALVAIAGLAPAAPQEQDRGPAGAKDRWVVNKVRLDLQVAGLAADGCEIEIKPATPSCKFEPIKKQVTPQAGDGGRLVVAPFEVKTASADRDCTFAITIREPNQRPRTVLRGLRLSPAKGDAAPPVKTLTCYLSTPSLAARDAAAPAETRKR